MHDADARTNRHTGLLKPSLQSRSPFVFDHAGRESFRTERQIITSANGAADKVDVAADSQSCEFDCVVKNKAARRHQRTLAEIERLRETDGVDEIGSRAEKLGLDVGAGGFDVARIEDNGDFLLFGGFSTQIKAPSDFEFGIAVEIKGQRAHARLKIEIRVEKIRVLVKNLAFVAALRNFDREGDR